MEEYEFVHYRMNNPSGEESLDKDDIPEELYVKSSKMTHFNRNMAAWKKQEREVMTKLTATEIRRLYK